MTRILIVFASVISLALFLTACGKKSVSQNASDASKSAGQAVGDAVKVAGNAVGDAAVATGEALGDAAMATGKFLSPSKDSDLKAARETIDGIEKEWAVIREKAAPATDEAKADLEKTGEEIGQAISEAREHTDEAKDATDDEWAKKIKPALDLAVLKTKKIFEDSCARFVHE